MINNIIKKILKQFSINEEYILDITDDIILDIDRVIEVYTDNYNLQKLSGKNIFYGYKELLDNLHAIKKDTRYVNICLIELMDEKKIIIFTDKDSFYLIGVLYSSSIS